MTIVAITACPTGIAHTYMAAERLEKTGKKIGIPVKVETQGAMGIENELSPADIKNADAVIYAVGIPVRKKERFAGKKIYEISVQDAIKNPEAILMKIKSELGG
jgi:fructose-specific phosphotransferase system IIB component